MPFAGLERPAIGISLLKGILARRGIGADIRYPNWDLAEQLGPDTYSFITDWSVVPHEALAGEWLFGEALYGPRPDADGRFVDWLRSHWHMPEPAIERLLEARAACTAFVDECLDTIDWAAYRIVGFTSTFEQNLASLALARRVKARHPDVVIAMGGANWEGEMGLELHRRFAFVDLVCSGEADESFPAAVEAILQGAPLDGIPGIVHRVGDQSVATDPGPVFRDLDSLPYPDYDDYVGVREAHPVLAERYPPLMLLQTARGCWWGERSHCTFCGLNGGTMSFRSKSADRVIEELRFLRERYGVAAIDTVDEILDMRYFKTLLPVIEDSDLDVELFYEIKANLTHHQVGQMARGRITNVQPGIESLSDHVLDLMAKGTSALKNVQLLKWCREYGITVYWNLLYGIPGETAEDYEEIARIIRAIWFLDPPTGGAVQLRLDRFSPYHTAPDRFGLSGVRASAAYRGLYDVDDAALDRIAYYFDFDYGDGRACPDEYARPAADLVQQWLADTDRGDLVQRKFDDGRVELVDTRPPTASTRVLRGWQAQLYLACDKAQPIDQLRAAPFLDGTEPGEVDAFVAELEAANLVLCHAGQVLSLAVHVPACAVHRSQPHRAAMTLRAG